MRYDTRTERIGEWFDGGAPDEWLAVHAAAPGLRALDPVQADMIRRLASPPPDGCVWLVGDGDTLHQMITVGLYDGWPFWRKRIAVLRDGTLGPEVAEAYNINSVVVGEPCDCPDKPSHRPLCRGYRVRR
jgi:hypothetical protein